MSRAITLNSKPRIRLLHKHALVFSSDWTITLTKTTSKTFRWLNTLLSTGPVMPNLGVYRHGSRMGWNVFLMKTSHTLQRGFGSSTEWIIHACPLCIRRNLEQFPYITPQGSDFMTWRRTSSPSIQSM